LQRTTLECPSGPPRKLGHTLEAGLFIHSRRLEVIARHPDPPKATTYPGGWVWPDDLKSSIQVCNRRRGGDKKRIKKKGNYSWSGI
jgi:hypothetical protein